MTRALHSLTARIALTAACGAVAIGCGSVLAAILIRRVTNGAFP